MKKSLNKKSSPKGQVITKEILINDLVNQYPQVLEILIDYGFHCIGCALSTGESLEQGALVHGLSDSDIEELVARLNDVILFGE